MEGREFFFFKGYSAWGALTSETANPLPNGPHLHARTPAKVNTDNKV